MTVSLKIIDSKLSTIKHLKEVAVKVLNCTSESLAQEITRIQLELFLNIGVSILSIAHILFLLKYSKPRDWMRHVLVKTKNPHRQDSIMEFSKFYNHLSSWCDYLS